MKAFIVAALLVAAVAGQSTMDILKLNKEKALLNKFDSPIMSELLLKKLGYPTEKTMFGDKVDVDMPLYLQDELMDKKVLNIEELMSHPLFREYINLPLFHQYIEYPAFQKFVTSVYFQKFWQIPAFKQYFLNPVFFYKYIYPIVNLFKTDITIPTSVYGDDLIKGSDMIVNKNVFPFVTGFEGDLLKEKLFVPTMYNEELKLKNNFHLKSLLVKIYSHLFNIPEELIKEHFLTEKFNYPVDTFKTFDSIYGDKLNKDVLLKKLLLNKMIVGDKTFDSIYGDKLNKDVLLKKLLLNKMMLGEKINYPFDSMKTMDSTIFEDKLTKDVLLKKLLLNKMILGDKTFKTVLPEEYILREKMMKMNPLVSRMMYGDNKLPIFNKFETIDNLEKMNMFDINMKKDLIKDEFLPIALKKELLLKDKILYNKIFNDKIFNDKIFNDKVQEINTFGTYETLPKVVDFTTPMMGVRTFDKKFFPETIIKA